MKAVQVSIILQNNIIRILLVTGAFLMIPLLAGFPWTIMDFVAMGMLLFGTGFALDYGVRSVDKKYRLVVGVAILGLFFVIWAQLSVNIIGKAIVGTQCVFERGMSVESVVSCDTELRREFED